MSRSLTLLVLCLLALSGCSMLGGGSEKQTYTRTAVTGLSMTPAVVHVGDEVLLDFEVRAKGFQVPAEYGFFDIVLAPSLSTSAGSILPIPNSMYQPAGPVPAFDSLPSPDDNQEGHVDTYAGFQEGHYFALFKAPDQPGTVEVSFFSGSSNSFTPEETTLTATIAVLP